MRCIEQRQGDAFDYVGTIPASFADGYFAGWTVSANVYDSAGALITAVTATWNDPAVTRVLHLFVLDTTTWPLGVVTLDVRLVRGDGYRKSWEKTQFKVV